jgi:hypothetical protein
MGVYIIMTPEEVDKINDFWNENPVEVDLDLKYDFNGTLDIRMVHKPIEYFYRLFDRLRFIPESLRKEFLLALEFHEREEYSLRFKKK